MVSYFNYAPGDIKIDTSGGVYGVEVGGGMGGGSGSAITTGAPGSSYTMNQGFTTGYIATPAAQTAGSVWFNPYFNFFQQMQIPAATFVGNSDYIFTRNTVTSQHAIIELSIPLSFFGTNQLQNISWAPSCDNSYLTINCSPVPEPSSVVLATARLAPEVRSVLDDPSPQPRLTSRTTCEDSPAKCATSRPIRAADGQIPCRKSPTPPSGSRLAEQAAHQDLE